jgi:hypothetical protein
MEYLAGDVALDTSKESSHTADHADFLRGRRADIRALVAADGSGCADGSRHHGAMGIAAGDSAARSGRSCGCTAGVRVKDGFTLPSTDLSHQEILPTTRSRIRCGRVIRPIRALISIARVVSASASVSIVA